MRFTFSSFVLVRSFVVRVVALRLILDGDACVLAMHVLNVATGIDLTDRRAFLHQTRPN